MPKQVLIVEDDKDIRETLGQFMELEGYSPVLAANGKEALEVLDRIKPNLILLDLMMPVMNGWQFLENVKLDPVKSAIPVIVVTAGGSQVSVPAEITLIRKPVDFEVLLREIQRHFA